MFATKRIEYVRLFTLVLYRNTGVHVHLSNIPSIVVKFLYLCNNPYPWNKRINSIIRIRCNGADISRTTDKVNLRVELVQSKKKYLPCVIRESLKYGRIYNFFLLDYGIRKLFWYLNSTFCTIEFEHQPERKDMKPITAKSATTIVLSAKGSESLEAQIQQMTTEIRDLKTRQ
jgi:hypothetical protein